MKALSVVIPVYFSDGSLPVLFDQFRVVEDQLVGLGVKIVKLARDFGAVQASKCGRRL